MNDLQTLIKKYMDYCNVQNAWMKKHLKHIGLIYDNFQNRYVLMK